MRKQLSLKAATQAGFTLIELIIVIVIIGILAAVAIPKYQDLSASAKQAVADSLAGSVASAAAVNYAKVSSGASGTKFQDCANVPTDWIPGQAYTVADAASASAPSGTVTTGALGDQLWCAVTDTANDVTSKGVTIIATGN